MIGSANAINTVQLLGSASAPVTATCSSKGLVNFQTVAFASGVTNDATLAIASITALPGTIVGFTGPLEAINLTGLADTGNGASTVFNTLTNVLTIKSGANSVQL